MLGVVINHYQLALFRELTRELKLSSLFLLNIVVPIDQGLPDCIDTMNASIESVNMY